VSLPSSVVSEFIDPTGLLRRSHRLRALAVLQVPRRYLD
jgi:hypothetical protein